jgi:IclR family transcriptional regulator, blcABC operon repressor
MSAATQPPVSEFPAPVSEFPAPVSEPPVVQRNDTVPAAMRGLVPALDRALNILALMESAPQRAYTVTELSRTLGIPKSSVFNICGAMAEGQLLRRTRDGFQLGRALVQLGSAYIASVNIVGEFYEVCRLVPPDLHSVIQLAVIDEGLDTVYLAHQDCNSGLRLGLGGAVGRRVPANCTACGKALLAMLTDAELERRLSAVGQLQKLTRKSVQAKSRLLQDIATTRETGVAIDEEETILGLSCVAAALATPHAEGGFVALSISAQTKSLTAERRRQIRRTLESIRAALQHRI